ncbi:MAG: ATP-binding cassette domain-containing protein [Sediminibacterium sp.]
MDIRLHHLMPRPLQDTPLTAESDIWEKEVTFFSGQTIKITARSGRGKTTLVHILAGLRNDYSGTVWMGNKNPLTCGSEELAHLRSEEVAVVFQDLRLFTDLSIRENTELKKFLPRIPIRENTVEDMAKELGIQHLLNSSAGTCSYGEQQRGAILRAMVQPFQWLILDEPFSHLDEANKATAIQLITSTAKHRKAGIILLDLEPDNHFLYHQQFQL